MKIRNTLAALVSQIPETHLEETALIFLDDQGKVLSKRSFAENTRICQQTARNLLAALDKQHRFVLLALEDPADFVSGFFACILAGKIPAPLPTFQLKPNKPGWGRFVRILQQHPTAAVLISGQQQAQIQSQLKAAGLQHPVLTIEGLTEAQHSSLELPQIEEDDIAYVQYTSGSTSNPKGILLTHRQVLHNMRRMDKVFGWNRETYVGWIPFHHDMGLVGHLFSVFHRFGKGVFLKPASFLVDPSVWLQAISDHRGTAFAAPTFAFEHGVRKVPEPGNWDLSCWKMAFVGSETVALPILDQFAAHFAGVGFQRNAFRPVYGLAEVTLLAAGGDLGLDELQDHIRRRRLSPLAERDLIPYTLPEDMQVSIHHPESGARLNEGETGEIWLDSPSNFSGYLEMTHLDGPKEAMTVKTGDLGFLQDGLLYLTGRLKETIIVRGVNYAAEDLEYATRANQPLLRPNDATVCLANPSGAGEELLVVQEVYRHLEQSQLHSILQQIQANLSEHFALQAPTIMLIPQGLLPRTGNYKIARLACTEKLLKGTLKILADTGSLQAKIQNRKRKEKADDPVVIIGMACRFPGGADTPEKFWTLLTEGRDAIQEVPEDRWDNALFYDESPAVPGKVNTKWAGFIDKVDHFDPSLFGISGYEASEIDPQQRLALETSWRLIEDTGWKKDSLKGSNTGVFIGISTNDYLYMKIKLTPGLESFNAYSGLGNAHSIAANRISYFYDLKGPSMAVDTACSSSLTAFHLGAQAILNGDCEQAMVGGVNAILSPGSTVTLSQFGMMAPDGRCKTFDDRADGYVRSEGCGLVMLKRRSAALRDGDRILATLAASSSSQDGASPGITFPNGAAQYQLIQQTLQKAGLEGEAVSYVEAHGTGTSSGDPVEMEQLVRLYGRKGADTCHVGSVKANIGHLEAGAGIAGVIKAVLMLQHQKIPPQIHFEQLNPKINLKHSRIVIPKQLKEWAIKDGKRRVAISSFGFGGSLAHAILEEAAPVPTTVELQGNYKMCPFVLSAYSSESLKLQMENWVEWLDKAGADLPAEYLFQAQAMTRSDLPVRSSVLAVSPAQLKQKLTDLLDRKHFSSVPEKPQQLCFLLTGQGERYGHMGKTMYHRFPVFRAHFDRCIDSLELEETAVPLKYIAFESTDITHWKERNAQPIQFAVQYAMGRFLMDLGLLPEVLLGYSLGEYAAACLAGCMEPEVAMQILHQRGLLVEQLREKGSMATIFTAAEAIQPLLDPEKVAIAVYNSRKKTVISGDAHEVKRLCDHFEAAGIETYQLSTQLAYHSHLVDPVLPAFEAYLNTLNFRAPTRKWLSPVVGGFMTEAPTTAHWLKQFREPVHFARTAELLPIGEEATLHFVEVGPGASTLVAVNDHLSPEKGLLMRTLVKRKNNREEDFYFLDTLCKLYELGLTPNWEALYGRWTGAASTIPGFRFNRRSYWIKGIDASRLSAFAGKIYAPASNGHHADNHSDQALFEAPSLHYKTAWHSIGTIDTTSVGEALKQEANWIVIGADSPLLQGLLRSIRQHQEAVFWLGPKTKSGPKPDIRLSDLPSKQELVKRLDRIINLQAKQAIDEYQILYVCGKNESFLSDFQVESLNADLQSNLGTFNKLLQALSELVFPSPVWLITENAQAVDLAEREALQLQLAPIWGFAKTAFLEHPEWRGGLIDVSAQEAVEGRCRQILQKILRPKSERCVLLRQGEQWIEQLETARLDPSGQNWTPRTDGAFIVTGGLGGLGLKCAHWLADKGAEHLILISRRTLPAQAQWDQLPENHPQYALVRQLLPLKEKVRRLELVSMDIRDIAGLKRIVAGLDEADIPLRGVLHAAGVNWFSKVVDLNVDELLETLKIKVASSWALHQLTQGRDLDCFILFSSVSALWGSVELSHYTAANYFLDMLALHRHRQGLPALSIDWGPWDEVGMSAKDREKELLQKLGFQLMAPATALQAMEEALLDGKPLYLVGDMNWSTFKPFIDFSLRPSLFGQLVEGMPMKQYQTSEGLRELLASPPKEARQQIEEVVRTELRRVMLIESMESLDDEHRFNFLGMDSLMAISFVVEIEQFFEIKLPNTLPYNYPHIRAVSDYLFETVYLPNTVYEDEQTANEVQEQPEIQETAGEWFPVLRDSKTKNPPQLYCVPNAGSGVSIFSKLAQAMPKHYKVLGIQPPGREERSLEVPFNSMTALVKELVAHFEPPEAPYTLLGHSLGGLVVYELYQALRQAGKKLPERLILSACGIPPVRASGNIHQMPDEAMADALLETFETSQDKAQRKQAILNTKAMVRADIQILETYTGTARPVEVPMLLLAGLDDPIAKPDQVREWIRLAEGDFSIRYVEAAHNLLQDAGELVSQTIADELAVPQDADVLKAVH